MTLASGWRSVVASGQYMAVARVLCSAVASVGRLAPGPWRRAQDVSRLACARLWEAPGPAARGLPAWPSPHVAAAAEAG